MPQTQPPEQPTDNPNPLEVLIVTLADLEAMERRFLAQPVKAQARFAKTVEVAKKLAPALDQIQQRLEKGWTLGQSGQEVFVRGVNAFANLTLTLQTYGLATREPFSLALVASLTRPSTLDDDGVDDLMLDFEDVFSDETDPISQHRLEQTVDYAGDALELWVIPSAHIGVDVFDFLQTHPLRLQRAQFAHVQDFSAVMAVINANAEDLTRVRHEDDGAIVNANDDDCADDKEIWHATPAPSDLQEE